MRVGGGWGVRGWVDEGRGWLGVPPTHVHMHAHARTCTRGKHDNFMQMAASIGFLWNPREYPMMSYAHVHACACVCTCVGAPSHHPHPHPPTPHPWGDPWNQSKFNST